MRRATENHRFTDIGVRACQPAGLDRLRSFAQGLDHPEGIVVTGDGGMYVGGEAGQVTHVSLDGAVTDVADTGGSVLGLALDGLGRIYACDQGRHAVLRIDPQTGRDEVFAAGRPGRPMAVPNWGAFDGAGRYFVSDSGSWGSANGLIWVVKPGGIVEPWSDAAADFPNGVAVSADGSRLYVAESTAGRILEIPILEDGSAGEHRVLCELGLVVPDGITIADDGALIVACYRPDVILRWHPDDGIDVLAADPQGVVLAGPTNVAFAGPDRGVLVVPNVAARHLTCGELGVRGAPLFTPGREEIGS